MELVSYLQNVASNTAFLKDIAKSVQILSAPKQVVSLTTIIIQIIASVFAILTALGVAFLMPFFIKRFQKPNLKPLKILRVSQSASYYFRLVIKNDSDFIAKSVEVDIEEISDDNGVSRNNLIPAPLRWTHGNTAPRDIFPHQTAYLDIIEAKQEANKFLHVIAPNIINFWDMVGINKGTSKLKLKYYNENGQAKDIKIKVVWNGREDFNDSSLPTVSVEE